MERQFLHFLLVYALSSTTILQLKPQGKTWNVSFYTFYWFMHC